MGTTSISRWLDIWNSGWPAAAGWSRRGVPGTDAKVLRFLSLYTLLLVVAYAVPVLFWLVEWASAWVLLPWLTVPLALRLIQTLYRSIEGQPLNRALARTANLDLAFSLLFALGLML